MLPVLAVAALLRASDPAPPAMAAPVEVKGAAAPASGAKRKPAGVHGKVAASSPAARTASPTPPAPAPAPAPAPPAPPAPAPTSAAAREQDDLLVRQKCGKCHDVSLAYSAELSDAHWKVHMKRMARVPGAAITDEQARSIHAHLKAVTGRR